MDTDLLDVPETAKYIRRSNDFVRRHLKHEVAHVQHMPCGPLFFYKRDLDRWLAARTVQPVR